MITILSTDNSQALAYVDRQLSQRHINRAIHIGDSTQLANSILSAVSDSSILIMIGDTFLCKELIVEQLKLTTYYDENILSKVAQYCKAIGRQLPARYQLDTLCQNIEGFLPIANTHGIECALVGKYNNSTIYILPKQRSQCAMFYDRVVSKAIDKLYSQVRVQYYKIYGLSNAQIVSKISPIFSGKNVTFSCDTDEYLDSTLAVTYPTSVTKPTINRHAEMLEQSIGHYLYANSAVSLAETAVLLLKAMHKTVSVAESVTGGLIANAFVEVAGASSVFMESCVTYATMTKQTRLGLNGNMIDVHGVVSSQVANDMAVSVQSQSRSDYSISITGSAGPTSYDGVPVGLCYIGICSNNKVKTYRTEHYGNRQSIRKQATNSALFLFINTIKNIDI